MNTFRTLGTGLSIILAFILISSCSSALTQLKPAEFKVNKVEVSPFEVGQTQIITIQAEIRNSGGIADNYTAILKVDDKERARQITPIDPSENKTVSFQITEPNIGKHKVSIGSEEASFNVYEPKKYLLRHDNGACSSSVSHYDPRGQWITFSPPALPFQISKILVKARRTDFEGADKKFYTLKVWDKMFSKELFSRDYPFSNFTTGFTMVEHKIDTPLFVNDDFTIDFISHSEDPGTGNNVKVALYTCVDYTVQDGKSIGASWLGSNDSKFSENIMRIEPRLANASWNIQVEGLGGPTQVTHEENAAVTNTAAVSNTNVPVTGRIWYPNPYVDIKISDFFYYQSSNTANCQLYCSITNKHDKFKMMNVTLRGVELFSYIEPGQTATIAKSIPCREQGPLKYEEFSWEWSQ